MQKRETISIAVKRVTETNPIILNYNSELVKSTSLVLPCPAVLLESSWFSEEILSTERLVSLVTD